MVVIVNIISLFSFYFVVTIVGLGILLIKDSIMLKENNKLRDYRISRFFGVLFIVLTPIMHLVKIIIERQ